MEDINKAGSGFESIGEKVDDIPVELSSRFLEHFSEQLYSSPNKAFEELVSNAWDAAARSVYIRTSDDFPSDSSCLYVLDDGFSMTAEGMYELWKVAHSPKESQDTFKGRSVIGRFGIGKLATYVLANKLTYICKGQDGLIRGVTMDYTSLDKGGGDNLLKNLNLEMREISYREVEECLSDDSASQKLLELIRSDFPEPGGAEGFVSEFGEVQEDFPEKSGCWTLVVLSDLKSQGKSISLGHLRRILSASLPLGAELGIFINDERVFPSKINKDIHKKWILGGFDEVEFTYYDSQGEEKVSVASKVSGKSALRIDGIGEVFGEFKLFEDKITGGKSDAHGASNGFHVNILGRVVNEDVSFGDKDFSHSVWARFRLTVRADGLNSLLSVNREQLFKGEELNVFRGFLRKCFNIARSYYSDVIASAWLDTGQAIIQAWGTLPLKPLRDYVENNVGDPALAQDVFDFDAGGSEREESIKSWKDNAARGMSNIIERVDFEEKGPDAQLAKYNIDRRSLIVNSSHPFAVEHAETEEERRVVRNVALLDLLTDAQAIDLGVNPALWQEVKSYRDNVSRLIAKLDRRSGVEMAKILMEASTYKDHRAFELMVGEALEYLGFSVEHMAKPGEPEGVAKAYPTPLADSSDQRYSFTYDAKSSVNGKVSAGNVGVAGLARHRITYNADYALVVAPEFSQGALSQECKSNKVTPMRAKDLGVLLHYTAKHGAISLIKLRDVFKLFDPDEVSSWVDELEEVIVANKSLSFDTFFNALKGFDWLDIPDAIAASHLATECRRVEKERGESVANIKKLDVKNLVIGLQVLVPDLIRVERDDVIVSVHPDKLLESVKIQLKKLDQE